MSTSSTLSPTKVPVGGQTTTITPTVIADSHTTKPPVIAAAVVGSIVAISIIFVLSLLLWCAQKRLQGHYHEEPEAQPQNHQLQPSISASQSGIRVVTPFLANTASSLQSQGKHPTFIWVNFLSFTDRS